MNSDYYYMSKSVQVNLTGINSELVPSSFGLAAFLTLNNLYYQNSDNMSTYNMIYGVNPATFFALPMITDQHPDELPRFRDCFAGKMTRGEEKDKYGIPVRKVDDTDRITIFTRTGGENRQHYKEENEALRQIEGFIEDYDDSFDNTFACWLYNIPERFIKDHHRIRIGEFKEISQELQERCYTMYPKLQEVFDVLFANKDIDEPED